MADTKFNADELLDKLLQSGSTNPTDVVSAVEETTEQQPSRAAAAAAASSGSLTHDIKVDTALKFFKLRSIA